MSFSDLINILIFISIITGIVIFFVIIAVKAGKKNRQMYRDYRSKFMDIANKYELSYTEQPFHNIPLPVISGKIDDFVVNYGIRYLINDRTTILELFFWRQDLDEYFPVIAQDKFSWVINKKPIGERKNLAFGIYHYSFVPNNLRISKDEINPEFEKRFELAGESEAVVQQFLRPQIQDYISQIIHPKERMPFKVLCYYDDKGFAYGQMTHDIIIRDMMFVDELLELCCIILKKKALN